MIAINYLDFDLLIEPAEPETAGYRARVLNSPAGQAETSFQLPFSDLELKVFLLSVGRTRRGVRRIDSPEMAEARKFGSQLYAVVFKDRIQASLLRSLDEAEKQGYGLRIRLRLTPKLINLPWEYLYDSALNLFFSHSINTPIVRYVELSRRIEPLLVQLPLKVLVMIASPIDYDQLDVEDEWRKVQRAMAELEAHGLVLLTRLPGGSLANLQKQLRRDRYHIFHFVGHGGFDQQTQEGVLLLEDENRRSRLVSGHYLGTLLHDHPSLRLAVLNACEGARTALADPFSGVAQHLVQQGVSAVIAMQFEITDKAAITLTHAFYDALADGYPVDAALAEARKAIFTAGNDIEWGTPALYLMSPDGRLFDVALADKAHLSLPKAVKISSDVRVITSKPANDTATSALSFQKFRNWIPQVLIATIFVILGYISNSEVGINWLNPKPTPTVILESNSKWGSSPTVNSTIWKDTRYDLTFVYVPTGKFIMGSNDGRVDEQPQHEVFLDAFWIMQTEVTNSQYKKCVDAGVCRNPKDEFWDKEEYQAHPVIAVDWNQANSYAAWVGGRLPTEAEWEKAARGTDDRTFPWGNQTPDRQYLHYNIEKPWTMTLLNGPILNPDNKPQTVQVGLYPLGASPYGALDMAGNVWEWVVDWHFPSYYKDSLKQNPQGPTSGQFRVGRGGSYNFDLGTQRVSKRYYFNPEIQYDILGFRIVRVVAPH